MCIFNRGSDRGWADIQGKPLLLFESWTRLSAGPDSLSRVKLLSQVQLKTLQIDGGLRLIAIIINCMKRSLRCCEGT